MSIFIQKLAEVVRKDPRYAYEAYEFVFQSLHYAQRKLGREPPATGATEETVGKHHVSGRELLEAARELALLEFGMMARYVLKVWGINRTEDVGNIVFNLIENELMSKTSEDSLDDFRDVFNLDEALEYQVSLDEAR